MPVMKGPYLTNKVLVNVASFSVQHAHGLSEMMSLLEYGEYSWSTKYDLIATKIWAPTFSAQIHRNTFSPK